MEQKPIVYYPPSPQYVPSYEEETPVHTTNLVPAPDGDNPDLEQNQDKTEDIEVI